MNLRSAAFVVAASLAAASPFLANAAANVDLAARPESGKAGNIGSFYAGGKHGNETECGLCHVPSGWLEVKFPHEQTGFALEGQHQKTACRACHTAGFETPTGSTCQSCHRDTHAGVLGALCESCHGENSWKTTFTVEAHQISGFPLAGAHAPIPCLECHLDARDRTFAAASTVSCTNCHTPDYQRSSFAGASHNSLGFGTDCATCHGAGSFSLGTFPGHDRCFLITDGPHASVSCAKCHTTLAGAKATGACRTNTETCVSCHTHQCSTTDRQHRNVPGYACADRKCYECHKFAQP